MELLSVEPRHSTPPLERLPLPAPSTATSITTRNLTPPPEPTSSIQRITTSTLPRHKTPPPYFTSPPRKPIDLPMSKSVSPTPSNGHTPTPHDMKLVSKKIVLIMFSLICIVIVLLSTNCVKV